MIVQCQCGQKNRVPDKPQARSTYLCGRCGSNLYIPTGSDAFRVAEEYQDKSQPKRIRGVTVKRLAVILVVLGFIFYNAWHDSVRQPAENIGPIARNVAIATNPAEAREQQIVEQDARRPGDAELTKDYQEVNERYFGNKLPKIPVLWEPKLEEVGPLKAKGLTEEGLAYSNPELILLNPKNRAKQAELRRVLCHEMVHVYLFTIGDIKTKHGPAFQAELYKLSRAGAFQGILATENEKFGLRSWLKNQSGSLDAESNELERRNSELDRIGGEIDRQKILMEQENDELNQRISRANEQGNGWPADDEIENFRARSRTLDQRVADFNASIAAFNASVTSYDTDLKGFNREVRRYNLMMAYPDGLDEDSMIPAKGEVHLRGSVAAPPEVSR